MDFSFTFFFNSILLGIGLAMDAFSVSVVSGIAEPQMSTRRLTLVAGVFSAFQGLMPLIGWGLVHGVLSYLSRLGVLVPWLSLLLLSYIGIRMLLGDGEEGTCVLTVGTLLLQGLATSVDALSVGLTLAGATLGQALASAAVIALVTLLLCGIGILLGARLGTRLPFRPEVLGGLLLIFIGVKILVSALLGA